MVLPGNRIVKTTVAVFLTAFLCHLIGWPPVFAVITAIVTLEPTVSDSIKKGIIRFPASAIGSFYAVLFIALFGNSPITYTVAASLTIITCYRLKLHAGLLVATITAVAMIEVVYDNYLLAFFIRLGTTTIGIVVSTLVNMFILPPDYMKEINRNLKTIYQSIGHVLGQVLQSEKSLTSEINNIVKQIDKTEELIRYQQEESFFHPLVDSKQENFATAKVQLKTLRFIRYHISNIDEHKFNELSLETSDMKLIINATNDLANYLQGSHSVQVDDYEYKLRKLMRLFWMTSRPSNENTIQLPQELIIVYELISIFHLVKQLMDMENQHSS